MYMNYTLVFTVVNGHLLLGFFLKTVERWWTLRIYRMQTLIFELFYDESDCEIDLMMIIKKKIMMKVI